MLRIIDRYLLTQLSANIIFGVVLFAVIWLAPETLFKLIQFVFSGRISFGQGVEMFFYHLPEVLQITIPMAALLGSVFLVRRLSLQFEWVIFLVSGISPKRLLWPVAIAGLACAVVHLFVQEAIAPVAQPKLASMYADLGLKDRPDDNFVFIEKNAAGDSLEKFLLIGRLGAGAHPNRHENVIFLFYQDPRVNGGLAPVSPEATPENITDRSVGAALSRAKQSNGIQIARIIRADFGEWSASRKAWLLSHGVSYELDKDGVYQETRRFKSRWVKTSPYPEELIRFQREGAKSLPFFSMVQYIELLKQSGQLADVPYFEVRLFQKLATPLSALILALVGAIVGQEKPRSRKLISLTAAALILFVYSISGPFAANMANLGVLPPFLAAFFPLTMVGLFTWGFARLQANR